MHNNVKLLPELSTHFETLRFKIARRRARIGILGLGYVGLPLACAYAEEGFPVTGFELDPNKVDRIGGGESYIGDVPSAVLSSLVRAGRLRATGDFDELSEQDAIIVCVPTPLRKTKEPDISYIVSATQQIKKRARPGQLVVLESTTYPGTTREILLSALASPDFQVGKDFFVAFSPERVDPANKRFTIRNTPKVVGGVTPVCGELVRLLYGAVVESVFPVSSVEVAEMTKLLENTFRAVNIGLVNEVAMMCDRLGISIWEVIEAAKTKPFGFMPFYPGPGIGGHCIPLDPHYLAWKVRSLNFEPRFIELADAINSRMPDFVIEKVSDILNHDGKALSRSAILALGVAYKKDTSDARESPALGILEKLRGEKATRVSYHDPYCPSVRLSGVELPSSPLTVEALEAADLVLILTDHSCVDYELVRAKARRILDTRNVFRGLKWDGLHYL